jgi:hypothetical protein
MTAATGWKRHHDETGQRTSKLTLELDGVN